MSSWLLGIGAVVLVALVLGVVLWWRGDEQVDLRPGPPGPLGPDGKPLPDFEWESPCSNLPPAKPGEPQMSD